MQKLTESAVRLRLDPLNWPPELSRTELSAPFEMNKAIELACDVFTRFQSARRAHASDPNLTPAGARAADAEFAAANLPALRERLAKIRKTAAQAESSMVAKLTADLTTPPIEPADVALMQEIRTWLRSLPESERLNRARKLASDRDKSALKAMLTAPTYLTGLSDEFIGLIRDDAAKRENPTRHAKLEAFRKAANAAERAVDGVARFVEQESGRAAETAASTPNAA
jgi:hypothetical protein